MMPSVHVGWRASAAAAVALLLSPGLSGCAPMHAEAASRTEAFAVRRAALQSVDHVDASSTYLLLRRAERRLYVISGDGETPPHIETFPVAVGRKEYETPTGRFAVTDKSEDPPWVEFDWNDPSRTIRTIPTGPENPLGRRWIGFTAAYGWQIGLHGTPQPELIGQAVSHGCVRMRNEDIMKIYGRVTVGTPVIVQP